MIDQQQYPISTLNERLLAATAIRIELPPSCHKLAIQRKAAIEKHLERNNSPLKDLIRLFYQQGSMAIGATIRASLRDEGYDIDIVVETTLALDTPPNKVLDLLFESVRGEVGSRYYESTVRQSRCVTVYYEDGMHLDLTPSILLTNDDPRRSIIFHSKPESPRATDERIMTNSHAFADEYNYRCPIDTSFAAEYARRSKIADMARTDVMLDADSEPVPEHSVQAGGKSSLTVALQLQKRHRNNLYQNRTGRMPPSVVLSCLALEVAQPGRTIGENLLSLITNCLLRLKQAENDDRLLHVVNPRCSDDCLTDRWPENRGAQQLYINDLDRMLEQVHAFMDPNLSLLEKSEILKALFGDSPVRSAIEDIGQEYGRAVSAGNSRTAYDGSVIVGAPAILTTRPKAPRNTFFGDIWQGK